MKVTGVGSSQLRAIENKNLDNSGSKVKAQNNYNTVSKENKINDWQMNILNQAITSLEENQQLDNSHPLGRITNRPIQSFEEALKELSFTKTETFTKQASNAQANLRIEDVISLFMEN